MDPRADLILLFEVNLFTGFVNDNNSAQLLILASRPMYLLTFKLERSCFLSLLIRPLSVWTQAS